MVSFLFALASTFSDICSSTKPSKINCPFFFSRWKMPVSLQIKMPSSCCASEVQLGINFLGSKEAEAMYLTPSQNKSFLTHFLWILPLNGQLPSFIFNVLQKGGHQRPRHSGCWSYVQDRDGPGDVSSRSNGQRGSISTCQSFGSYPCQQQSRPFLFYAVCQKRKGNVYISTTEQPFNCHTFFLLPTVFSLPKLFYQHPLCCDDGKTTLKLYDASLLTSTIKTEPKVRTPALH